MLKRICDICKTNKSNTRFKVKVKDTYCDGNYTTRWLNLDICSKCYNNLINLCKQSNNEICKYYVTYKSDDNKLLKSVCYGTKGAEECYCKGLTKYCTHYPEKRHISE